jgi:hypothetical protein
VERADRAVGLRTTGWDADGGYADYATLTAVTVGGVTYPVESSTIPVAAPGSGAVTLDNTMGSSPHDATFVLSQSVEIER